MKFVHYMENKDNKPKGILKKSRSRSRKDIHRSATFDEMNIISTLHPKEKDYGHDKIDEPKTPFSYEYQDAPSTSANPFNPLELAAKIKAVSSTVPTVVEQRDKDERSKLFEKETPEERQKRLEFEKKRKQHYNEFQTVKLVEKDETQGHSSKK